MTSTSPCATCWPDEKPTAGIDSLEEAASAGATGFTSKGSRVGATAPRTRRQHARELTQKRAVGAAVALIVIAGGGSTVAPPLANAGRGDCGVHLLGSLDPKGANAFGGMLDLTEDGIYVGSAADQLHPRRALPALPRDPGKQVLSPPAVHQ